MTRKQKYVLVTRVLILLALIACLSLRCGPGNLGSKQHTKLSQPSSNAGDLKDTKELTSVQQSAFDALNELQVSTDEKNRLYSTFPGIDQLCYPADTSLTISQTDLLTAMKKFVATNCRDLSPLKREELAAASVLAQKEYIILLCLDGSTNAFEENGAPMTGTWVMPSVLGRRDVVIVW